MRGLLPDDEMTTPFGHAAATWWRILDQLRINAKPGPQPPPPQTAATRPHDHEITTTQQYTQAALAPRLPRSALSR
jgi:hypothetical protein